MGVEEGGEPVAQLWRAFGRRDWGAARELLHPDLAAEWPQTGERFDRGGYIAVNETYPGSWEISIRRIVALDDLVVSEVFIEHSEPERTTFAVGLYELEGGRIRRATEYWPAPAEPSPERREQAGRDRDREPGAGAAGH